MLALPGEILNGNLTRNAPQTLHQRRMQLIYETGIFSFVVMETNWTHCLE